MTMTEADAKTKWCPFSRFGVIDTVAPNRFGAGSEGSFAEIACRCIGSACMAWRKRETAEFSAKAEAEFRKTGRRLEPDTGYCGLAGRPSHD